jgi:hypothetical protein
MQINKKVAEISTFKVAQLQKKTVGVRILLLGECSFRSVATLLAAQQFENYLRTRSLVPSLPQRGYPAAIAFDNVRCARGTIQPCWPQAFSPCWQQEAPELRYS